jgi:NAD+ kinase
MEYRTKKVKNVVIIVNKQKAEGEEFAKSIVDYLTNKNINSKLIVTAEESDLAVINEAYDLAICLGGDGTVLSCARFLHSFGIPILAVNLGTFGFITEVCKEEWQEAFELYEQGRARLSRRLMIKTSVIRESKRIFTAHALNEITIAASGISKMVQLDLFLNETNAGKMRSDGIIISTPTGSTAYSLAAGGPILDVDLEALIINPICPFTLSNRPLVVSSDNQVRIVVNEKQKTKVSLTVDGQQFFQLQENDIVEIVRSHSRALLIRSPKRNYYEVIREKLNWSGAMHA